MHDVIREFGEPLRTGPPGSRSPAGEKRVTASRLTVAEDDDIISFYLRGDDGLWTFVQYTRDQVWRDERGVWQVREREQPFYAGRASGPPEPVAKLCPLLSRALDEATKAPFRR